MQKNYKATDHKCRSNCSSAQNVLLTDTLCLKLNALLQSKPFMNQMEVWNTDSRQIAAYLFHLSITTKNMSKVIIGHRCIQIEYHQCTLIDILIWRIILQPQYNEMLWSTISVKCRFSFNSQFHWESVNLHSGNVWDTSITIRAAIFFLFFWWWLFVT
jgi:hypothetical protein